MRQTKQGDGFSNLFRKSASRQSNGRKARNQLKIFIVLIEKRLTHHTKFVTKYVNQLLGWR